MIKDIPNNFFRNSSKLKTLEILNSFITLRKENFDGLLNLSLLKLDINIDRENVKDDIFDSLRSLQSLEISHKTLNNLSPRSFRNLMYLENIILFGDTSDTEFINLKSELLTNLTSMKSLNLKLDGLKDLSKDDFSENFGMLEKLSISGYQLKTFPLGIFNNLRNIRTLEITHTNLTSLPNYTFEKLKKLKNLDLSYNYLDELDMKV